MGRYRRAERSARRLGGEEGAEAHGVVSRPLNLI